MAVLLTKKRRAELEAKLPEDLLMRRIIGRTSAPVLLARSIIDKKGQHVLDLTVAKDLDYNEVCRLRDWLSTWLVNYDFD